MGDVPDVQAVDTEDDYVHVRFRDPDEFDTIRTPDWAQNAAGSVRDGAEVRTGKEKGSDDWEIQSVLIPKGEDEDEAKDEAKRIVDKINS
ncbi:hypothetical protein ACFQGT_00770 [Natrialbaceae archaeon GCM10025810]|uniref:hypothetical protein n=1 Tax=Halovalidus salilacus TaxID=3075124 RepID=UPI0036171215